MFPLGLQVWKVFVSGIVEYVPNELLRINPDANRFWYVFVGNWALEYGSVLWDSLTGEVVFF